MNPEKRKKRPLSRLCALDRILKVFLRLARRYGTASGSDLPSRNRGMLGERFGPTRRVHRGPGVVRAGRYRSLFRTDPPCSSGPRCRKRRSLPLAVPYPGVPIHAVRTLAALTKAGSIVTPSPGPVGTLRIPLTDL